MRKKPAKTKTTISKQKAIVSTAARVPYGRLVSDISHLLEQARRWSARSVNAILTATYWQIGRRIVEHEQGGKERAGYGGELIEQLAKDLTARHEAWIFGPGNLQDACVLSWVGDSLDTVGKIGGNGKIPDSVGRIFDLENSGVIGTI